MDDLKLYGKSKDDLESLVRTVRIYTEGIRMRFGLTKCVTLVMKRGKKVEDDGIVLPDGQIMKDLGDSGYKYLGVLEANDIKMNVIQAFLLFRLVLQLTMWNNSTENNSTSLPEELNVIQQALGLTLAVMLGLVIFALGCSVEVSKIWLHLKRPWGILVGLVCQFIIMPLTAYLLALAFSVSPVQAIAVIVIGSCPGGTISNIVTYWLDGDMDLSITMTTVSTLLGLGAMPLNLYLYSSTWVKTGKMELPFLNIGLACVSLVVPVTCGVLVNYKWPKAARIILKVGSIVGGVIMLAVGIASIFQYDGLWNTSTSTLVIGSIFPLIGTFAGFLISICLRQPWNRCRTIAMETGAQNMQICGTVLQLFLPPQQLSKVIILPLMYSCFQLLTGVLLVIAFQIYKRTQCRNYFLTSEEKGQREENDGPTGEINAAFESESSCKSHRNTEQPNGSVTDFSMEEEKEEPRGQRK
ncbi:sodium-dependent organic anion transporter-like [Neoarius graeffei]|uniref:sodium-dependent organic anion transporter-like n=1 Tax=Neoarius graeffei TaxID=443677 RepID=UPI00298C69E7|nr:sodium-dependent organic anion transporter-like [Neoarius graeffei]